MPKTATGKVQRRLVAKAMIEGEQRGSTATSSVPSVEKKEFTGKPGGSSLLVPFIRFFSCVLPRRK
jgi:hypothetical protein